MSAANVSWASGFLDVAAPDHPGALSFWSRVTGYAVSPTRGEHDEFVTLVPPDGDDHLRVQRLADGPSRLHLDLHVASPREAADRALDRGAVEVADLGYVVLRSPAGLTFCFVDHPASRRSTPASWPGGRSQVDQVCLDVPPSTFEAEVEFWAGITGFAETPATTPTFRRLDGPVALRFLFQVLDDDREPGYHLDLAVDDRAAETRRHLDLGARHVRTHDRWTVLADPAGLEYCLTDRAPRNPGDRDPWSH